MKPFDKPIYVTQPIFPNMQDFVHKLEEIWEDKWLTNMGRQHVALEQRLQKYLNVPYLSLFNNGTIALIVACQSLRLTGEVITTPFTFAATPHVLTWNNIKPVFCDIDPLTMNIDANKIESMITPSTTGILPVHVFGTPCDVDKIQQVADRYGLKVVYDAAHAFGVKVNGQGIGNFGDISMFSFHATKAYHTVEGGALTYKDENFKQRVDLLKNFGIKNEEEVVMPGINGKMNEIQAAMGLLILDYFEQEKMKRKRLIETYKKHLEIEGITFYVPPGEVETNAQYFVIRINEKSFGASRDQVYTELKNYNVFSRKYFYPLCSEYPCYRQLPSSNPTNLPVASQVVKEVLSLPLYGALSPDDVAKICEIILSIPRVR